MEEPHDLQLAGWTLKVRPPAQGGEPHPVIFLVHGWTGDERSMWVFAQRMPRAALLIAPRAPFVSNNPDLGGFSWVESRAAEFSQLPAFDPAVEAFDDLLAALAAHYPAADFTRFGLVGFSQGGAFGFAYAMRHPQKVSRLAALAGFLPSGSEAQLSVLENIPVLIAHGSKDETVPVTKAREAQTAFAQAGVAVQYCEADTGHKLGAKCFTQLAEFFR
ncbi:MAG: alpha/beta fold hydrolase [Anaerolineales bacterium]